MPENIALFFEIYELIMDIDRTKQWDVCRRLGIKEDIKTVGLFQQDAQFWNKWGKKIRGSRITAVNSKDALKRGVHEQLLSLC